LQDKVNNLLQVQVFVRPFAGNLEICPKPVLTLLLNDLQAKKGEPGLDLWTILLA
jgi:hypothetical protein